MSLKKNITLWVIAIVVMAAFAIYQRTTGPTYPIHDSVVINGTKIKFKLPRTFGGPGDAPIEIEAPSSIQGRITWKRFRSHDEDVTVPMVRNGKNLVFMVPHQPPAGKIQYSIELGDGNTFQKITDKEVRMRFKGEVPDFILYPHILAMFLSLFFAGRVALEAFSKGDKTYKLTLWTMGIFLFGGFVLGPLVQFYAFGALWTGWPISDGVHFNLLKFGDLTDNKTLMAVLGWVIAWFNMRNNPQKGYWGIIAFFIMVIAYLIPHSLLGSELDYTKLPK